MPGQTGGPGTTHAERSPAAKRGTDYPGDLGLSLRLWTVLSRAATAVRRQTEKDIARHEISPTEFAILETLFHKGPLLLGELQRKVLISSGGITYVVDRLEADGLVERRACPSDRRARYAALTSEGERWVSRHFPDHARAVHAAVSGLSPEEQRTALALLRKLGLHAAGETT